MKNQQASKFNVDKLRAIVKPADKERLQKLRERYNALNSVADLQRRIINELGYNDESYEAYAAAEDIAKAVRLACEYQKEQDAKLAGEAYCSMCQHKGQCSGDCSLVRTFVAKMLAK